MLSIKVNGIFLDLDATSIRFEIINSMLEQSALQGDWSFPFPIKWSDRNGVAFAFANMLEVPNKKIYYQATCYFGTKSFVTGRLILNGGGNDYFNSSIAGGVKALVNSETNLKDLNYINPVTGDGTIVLVDKTTAALDFQTADYNNIIAFPTHSNPNFYGNSNADFQGIVNIVIAESGIHPMNAPETGGNKYCLVPFLYLFYILKTAFKECGLTPSGTFWNDAEMSKALVYNNYAMDKILDNGSLTYPLVEIVNDLSGATQALEFSDLAPGANDDGNNFDNTLNNGRYNIPTSEPHAIKLSMDFIVTGAVGIRISIWKNGVEIHTNPGIMGTSYPLNTLVNETLVFADPDAIAGEYYWATFVYFNTLGSSGTVTIKTTSYFKVYKYDGAVFNQMDEVCVIKNHVPDITLEGLLNELKKWLQLDFVYDFINNKVFINYIDNVLSGPAELDLTPNLSKNYELLFDEKNKGYVVGYDFGSGDNLIEGNFKSYDPSKLIGYYNSVDLLPVPAAINDLAIVKSTNKVMRVEQGLDLAWKEFTDNYYDVKTGNGDTAVKTLLAPMMMLEAQNETNIAPDPANTRALIPAISETGSSPMFDLGINTPSLRIVFMRGLNTPDGQYVCASSTNYDQLGVQKGNHTMKMNDDDGLHKKCHEKIINALTNGDTVERDFSAGIYLLTDPRLKRKVSANNMHWLLKSVSPSIGKTLKISKSKWLKL